MAAVTPRKIHIPDPVSHIPGANILDPLVPINKVLSGKSPLPSTKSITAPFTTSAKFFEALVNPDTWVRVGEVTVGVILLVIGFDYMTKADVASKLAKVAPFV